MIGVVLLAGVAVAVYCACHYLSRVAPAEREGGVIVRKITQIRCDRCTIAWIYPEGDIVKFLTANGWRADGPRHECPRCVRQAAS